MPLIEALTELAILPARSGTPPRTALGLPHVQLDQWPPEEIALELIERSLQIPGVQCRQSRMASPQSRALCLPDRLASGPRDAFVDNHEFCYLHPLPEAGIHLTLPRELREKIFELGWAEPHPLVRSGAMPQTLVMVYSPRHDGELPVVFSLIWSSCQFARGQRHHSFDLIEILR